MLSGAHCVMIGVNCENCSCKKRMNYGKMCWKHFPVVRYCDGVGFCAQVSRQSWRRRWYMALVVAAIGSSQCDEGPNKGNTSYWCAPFLPWISFCFLHNYYHGQSRWCGTTIPHLLRSAATSSTCNVQRASNCISIKLPSRLAHSQPVPHRLALSNVVTAVVAPFRQALQPACLSKVVN